jgi:tetratricopeptide (TPR) repeat protein
VAIVSYGTENILNYAAYAFAVDLAYAEHNGYNFQLADPKISNYEPADARWNKVKIVEHALNTWAKDADFLVWLDADLIILDMDMKLETIVANNPEAHLWFSAEHANSHNLVNSGFMIVRNSKFVKWFLNEWWNFGDREFLADQDQFDHVYAHYKEEKRLDLKVAVLPPDALNSEPPAAVHQKDYNQVLHLMGEHTQYRVHAFGTAFDDICRVLNQQSNTLRSPDSTHVRDGNGAREDEDDEAENSEEDYDDDYDDYDDDNEYGEDDENDGSVVSDVDLPPVAKSKPRWKNNWAERGLLPATPLRPQLGVDRNHLVAWALIEYKREFNDLVNQFTDVLGAGRYTEANQVTYMNTCACRYAEVLESIETTWNHADITALRRGVVNRLDRLVGADIRADIATANATSATTANTATAIPNKTAGKMSCVGSHPESGAEVRIKTFYLHLKNVEASEKWKKQTIASGERQVLLYELTGSGRQIIKILPNLEERRKLTGRLIKHANELLKLVPQPRKTAVSETLAELYMGRGMVKKDGNDMEEALEDFQKSLKMKEQIAKEVGDHNLPAALIIVSDALCRLQRYRVSWPYFDRALEIAERRLGPQHQMMAFYLYLAGQGPLAGGDAKTASGFLTRAIAAMEAQPNGMDDLPRARELFAKAQQSLAKNKGGKALPTIDAAEAIRGVDNSKISSSKNTMKKKTKKGGKGKIKPASEEL